MTPDQGLDVSFLPAVNASLNATAAVLLLCGFAAVKRGRRDLHRNFMISALVVSGLFLVSYLVYHSIQGDTRYPHDAPLRALYLVVLLTHVLLSVLLPFLVVTVVYLAARGRFDRHRRIARIALPVWLYVSVTGVVIFLMLRSATAYLASG